MVVAIFTALLTGATVAGTAYLGHRFQLAHLHILGIIPIGALAIGAGAVIGVALAIRLTSNYDTAGFRFFGQLVGASAYAAVVLTDYATLLLPVGTRKYPAPQLMGVTGYFRLIADQQGVALAAQVPPVFRHPQQLNFWIGLAILAIELVGAVIITGWVISLLTGVPFCGRSRRFYVLKDVVESADTEGLREWERAMDQRRPIEARTIFARFRAAGVNRGNRTWTRVAVHQCPVCLNSRVRIQQRRRVLGLVKTDAARDLPLDGRESTALSG